MKQSGKHRSALFLPQAGINTAIGPARGIGVVQSASNDTRLE